MYPRSLKLLQGSNNEKKLEKQQLSKQRNKSEKSNYKPPGSSKKTTEGTNKIYSLIPESSLNNQLNTINNNLVDKTSIISKNLT